MPVSLIPNDAAVAEASTQRSSVQWHDKLRLVGWPMTSNAQSTALFQFIRAEFEGLERPREVTRLLRSRTPWQPQHQPSSHMTDCLAQTTLASSSKRTRAETHRCSSGTLLGSCTSSFNSHRPRNRDVPDEAVQALAVLDAQLDKELLPYKAVQAAEVEEDDAPITHPQAPPPNGRATDTPPPPNEPVFLPNSEDRIS